MRANSQQQPHQQRQQSSRTFDGSLRATATTRMLLCVLLLPLPPWRGLCVIHNKKEGNSKVRDPRQNSKSGQDSTEQDTRRLNVPSYLIHRITPNRNYASNRTYTSVDLEVSQALSRRLGSLEIWSGDELSVNGSRYTERWRKLEQSTY